jgi:hypothetical protein
VPLPTWAEAYQNDDVDESVRDYVEQLLQRMGTGGEEKPVRTETPDVASRVAKAWESACPTEAVSESAETKTDGSSEDGLSVPASPPPELEQTEPSTPVENTRRTAEDVAPVAPASNDPAQDLLAESPGYTNVESYSPRSLPPERLANLNELRELANISATAAIRTFEKGRAAKNAFDRVPLIMVGLSCGLFLLYFATTCDNPMMQMLLYAGVGLSFLAASVAAGQALSVLFRWLATARRPQEPQDDASLAFDDSRCDL